MWGQFIEGELDKISHDNLEHLRKLRLTRLHVLLGLSVPEVKGMFADPVSMF